MLIVVNAIFSMFSFLQVALFIYVQAWRARSRSGVSCFPTDRADLHRCRSGVSCFPHRLRRWRQGVSVSFVTMLHVTCYNKVVPYCAGWALRNYIVYILCI